MAYSRTTWASGDTITAAKLNNIETALVDASDITDTVSYANAGAHNSIYRGKSLGSSVTSTQASAISGATFNDIYVGDYWTISSVTYRNMGCDYNYRTGSTSLSTHHLILVPDSNLYTAPMNSSNTTSGGYAGSAMHTGESITVSDVAYTGLTNARNTIASAFGSYLLSYDDYLTSAVTSGYPSSGAWETGCTVELLNEQAVYGCPIYQQMCYGGTTPNKYTIFKCQLPGFQLNPALITIRANWWLRDIASASNFAYVNSNGYANHYGAANVVGVRPAFHIS